MPTLSGAVAFIVALVLNSTWDEALLAGAVCAAGPAFGIAAWIARHRSAGTGAAYPAAAALAALALIAGYAYGRLAGYATGDIRIALGIVLVAMALACAVHAASIPRRNDGLSG